MPVMRTLVTGFLLVLGLLSSFVYAEARQSKPDISRLADSYPFYGMAGYLNQVNYYVLDSEGKRQRIIDETVDLQVGQTLVASGRYNALIVNGPVDELELDTERLMSQLKRAEANAVTIELVSKNELGSHDPKLEQIRYAQLWWPMAQLAKLMQWLLTSIQALTGFGWGLSLVVFAVVIKLLLYPASVFTTRLQNQVALVQSQLNPKLAEIKASYKGEEAHNRIMAAHKKLGVSPFYTLKPSIGFFIQIPVFIAIFNALGEMPQFAGESFLWIKDLAYPDAVFPLGFSVPWLGDTFNLTPFLMAVVAVISAMTYRLEHIDEQTLKAKRKQLIYMGLVFLVLFFPFPAAMTFYWFMANFLQMVEQNVKSKVAGL